jgi:hypothetical protein
MRGKSVEIGARREGSRPSSWTPGEEFRQSMVATASFDKAIVLFGVAGLPEPGLAMHELRRVCRPGARIVIASRFRAAPSWLTLYDVLASPLYRFLAYRSDLDRNAFLAESGLKLIRACPANLFGYSTILVCSNS